MDDRTDDRYARAPEFEDILTICRELNRCGAQYLLIGGFAVMIYGFTRGTKDIDFLVNDSAENIQKIKQALSCLKNNAAREIKDDDVKTYQVVRVADDIVVDLLGSACGVNYKMALADSLIFELDDVESPLVSKETLIKTKDTVRPHDKRDVDYLKMLIEQEKNLK
jgi:hypothetical protein